MGEKRCFFVNFMWSENVYCANIVYAENMGVIAEKYSKYGWYQIRNAKEYELESAKRKGMPIIEL